VLWLVSEQLPIALTPDDVEHYPEFRKLLKALTQHILPSGASVASEEDVREVLALVAFSCLCCFVLKSLLLCITIGSRSNDKLSTDLKIFQLICQLNHIFYFQFQLEIFRLTFQLSHVFQFFLLYFIYLFYFVSFLDFYVS